MYVIGCYINGDLIATARGQSLADAQMGASLNAAKVLHLDEIVEHYNDDPAFS